MYKKKLLSIALCAAMVLGMGTTAFAADTQDDTEIYSASELEVMNSESQSKGEAILESEVADNGNGPIPRAALPSSPNSATSITGNTPNFSGSYTLSAGANGYVKLTPGQNYYVSAFTTGSTDTYIEVYDSVACTNRIYYNDDGGHGSNANTTYYIKVRGFNSSASGAYKFYLHRGQPTSRSEKGDMFTTYNSSTYKGYNNCYTYALSYYVNPITGSKFRGNGQNPGEMGGRAITGSDLVNASTAKNAIEAGMTRDFDYFGGEWAEIAAHEQPRAGFFKVALVLAPGKDYHWYRENPSGKFTHKRGSTQAIEGDASNYLIYQPSSCDRNYGDYNYTNFLGYYEIKVPTSASPHTTVDDTLQNTYPTKLNITMSEVEKLSHNTTFEEALELLGEPHEYRGSGMVGSIYVLSNNEVIGVYYADGKVDQIRKFISNDEFGIIL